ncbi:hypothetical protein P3T36_006174 [Kitasatospora sp. MAP12-15]|uniref:hypothetical protein n=1 Tax=unclassified Kitasatospora TaxID=2633591 RepID=UPI002474D8B6|nr:hypothetical protein [Kitasatospora sp. MAP12-44]MDH6110572.1 hypothetical protein [Kitasatospora sp. MAP12-44]
MATSTPPFRSPVPGGAPGGLLGGAVHEAPLSPPAAQGIPPTCDTVTVPLRHGLETVDILRLRRACGSALQGAGATVSFLVPAGTAERWHLPGTSCTAGAAMLPATDPRWLVPPAGAGCAPAATDPWVLRSVLCEAACTLTAGGLGPF